MGNPGFVVRMLWLGVIFLGAGAVSSQDYPTRPIRIVTAEVGGGNDFAARIVAQGLGAMGQPVIVENRPSGVIPGEIVARAPPDGHTVLLTGSTLWIGPLLRKTPYDPVKDFSPITLATTSPLLLIVHPSVSVSSVKELIDLAKAKPGVLNYGSAPVGSATYLAAELFKSMAGVNIVQVVYKGAAPALVDVLSGQIQLTFGTAAASAPHINSGKLRALAVTSAQPSAVYPGLPTIAASLTGYESGSTYGVLVPARTPPAIVTRLNREIVRFLNTAEVKERFLNAGVDTVGSSPEQFARAINADIARIGKVLKEAGIKAD